MTESAPPTMRIAQFLARCGIASRRNAEQYVRDGRVALNGEIIHDLGRRIDPDTDNVLVDGKQVNLAADHLTLAMHKPTGVVVTRSDPQGRRTIFQTLPPPFAGRARELIYAGRLDVMTSGLLILTTDGVLANRLTHPRHHVEKAYRAVTNRQLTDEEMALLRAGVDIGGETTLPCQVNAVSGGAEFTLEVILREGRNRQVRRMIEAVGAKTARLERIRIGGLSLKDLGLRSGQCIALTPAQIELLFAEP